jgi:hypothetical protein
MLAPDNNTADRLRKLQALADAPGTAGEGAAPVMPAPGIVPQQRPLSRAARDRLFGPVAFESGLPTRFLLGQPWLDLDGGGR